MWSKKYTISLWTVNLKCQSTEVDEDGFEAAPNIPTPQRRSSPVGVGSTTANWFE